MAEKEEQLKVFYTDNFVGLYIAKNCIETFLGNIKISRIYNQNTGNNIICVDKDMYEKVIDKCMQTLKMERDEDTIYYFSKDQESLVKCGYYRLGYAKSKELLQQEKINLFRKMTSEVGDIYITYDNENDNYLIDVKADSYDDYDLKFKKYLSTYGSYPFYSIDLADKYGSISKENKKIRIKA